MGVYERQRKEKAILESAIKLFSSKGYHSTKMEEVAKQAKMSKGLIYFYYKNKEDLYMAVTKKAFDELHVVFKNTAKTKGKSGIELITDLVHNFFSFTLDNRMFHEAILNFLGIMALYDDERLRQKIDPLILQSSNFSKLLETHSSAARIGTQIISQGIEDGSIRNDLQPEITFYTIWTLMVGYERLQGPIAYDLRELKIDRDVWQKGFLKLVHDMLKKSQTIQKPQAVQGSLF